MQESLFDKLSCPEAWNSYLNYKAGKNVLTQAELEDLVTYIDERQYLPVVKSLCRGEGWGIPAKKVVAKLGSTKKRVVYSFGREQNYVLKLLTYLLLRKYDSLFPPNLYSFRTGHGVQSAVNWLKRQRNLRQKFVYKLDVHDYFNSIDIDLLLPALRRTMADDVQTERLIEQYLLNPEARLVTGEIVREKKGIMAGVPLASFLANLYLADLDMLFLKKGIDYARYSDDIIVFADSEEELMDHRSLLLEHLDRKHLEVNPAKESLARPGEMWVFLGVSYQNGIFDIAPASAKKLCDKMRRKARALERWGKRREVDGLKAAKVLVRKMNLKLFDRSEEYDLNWTRWFFPLINTAQTLKRIDSYMQDCIRRTATSRRNKLRFRLSYDQMKEIGYRSLVHEYYQNKKPARMKVSDRSGQEMHTFAAQNQKIVNYGEF